MYKTGRYLFLWLACVLLAPLSSVLPAFGQMSDGRESAYASPVASAAVPVSLEVSSAARRGSFLVRFTGVTSDVSLDVKSDATWLTVTKVPAVLKVRSGIAKGTVYFSVTENPSVEERSGTISVNGAPYVISQTGAPCRVSSISTAPSTAFSAAGGAFTLTVKAPEGCTWNVAPAEQVSWLASASGTGRAQVNVRVGDNLGAVGTEGKRSSKARSAKMVVRTEDGRSKKSFAVKQAGGGRRSALRLTDYPVSSIAVEAGTVFHGVYDSIFRLPAAGGEIETVLTDDSLRLNSMAITEDRIFMLNGISGGGMLSTSKSGTGITLLAAIPGYERAFDVVSDGEYVFGSTKGKIYRTPLHGEVGSRTEVVFTGEAGSVIRMALDGDKLYVTDSLRRKLYLLKTDSLAVSEVYTFTDSPTQEFFYFGIPVVTDAGNVYALVENRYLHRIGKDFYNDILVTTNYMSFDTAKITADPSGVYWWLSEGGQLLLKKYDSASSEIKTITTIPSQWFINGFASDGSHIYWGEEAGYQSHPLKRVSVSGGSPETVTTTTSQFLNFAFSTDTVIWSDNDGSIMKAPKSGGVAEKVAYLYSARPVAVVGESIIAGHDYYIKKMPLAGPNISRVEWSQPLFSNNWAKNITTDGTSLFWALQTWSTISSPLGETEIYKRGVGGGEPEVLASLIYPVNRIYPKDDFIYLLKETLDGGIVSRIPVAGGSEQIVLRVYDAMPVDIHIRDNVMFFITTGNLEEATGLNIYDLTSGTGTIIAGVSANNGEQQLHADNRYLYWASAAGLFRMLFGSPVPEKIYSGGVSKIAGDETAVYFVTQEGIMRTSKGQAD